jgi:predicted enzyme related to lactoylglutathione lyase
MEKVIGFGGFFFRAKDPEALGRWYRDHLGIDLVPQAAEGRVWQAGGGPTVFAPFVADTDYFAADKPFMLNFRVADLDALMAQLEAAGIAVKPLEEMPGIGRFAHLADPEGTPIELWEPA